MYVDWSRCDIWRFFGRFGYVCQCLGSHRNTKNVCQWALHCGTGYWWYDVHFSCKTRSSNDPVLRIRLWEVPSKHNKDLTPALKKSGQYGFQVLGISGQIVVSKQILPSKSDWTFGQSMLRIRDIFSVSKASLSLRPAYGVYQMPYDCIPMWHLMLARLLNSCPNV